MVAHPASPRLAPALLGHQVALYGDDVADVVPLTPARHELDPLDVLTEVTVRKMLEHLPQSVAAEDESVAYVRILPVEGGIDALPLRPRSVLQLAAHEYVHGLLDDFIIHLDALSCYGVVLILSVVSGEDSGLVAQAL